MTRHSLIFTALKTIAIVKETLPTLQAKEVLVKAEVSAISAGTELLVYRGEAPAELPADETIASLRNGTLRFPLKYGYAVVGRVNNIGVSVDPSWLGRRVFGFHPHESHFIAQINELHPVPENMSAECAVFLPSMETAVSMLMDGRTTIGEQVVIFGQGTVGLLTTALLAHLPLATLVTVDAHELRRDWSIKLGAQFSLDSNEPKLKDKLLTILHKEPGCPGTDLAIELSGRPEALEQAIGVTGPNGRVLIGSWYGQRRVNLDLGGEFHRSGIKIISSQVSRLAPQWSGRWTKARRLQVAWEMLEQLQPTTLITHRIPLAEATSAYGLLNNEPETAGQVILRYD